MFIYLFLLFLFPISGFGDSDKPQDLSEYTPSVILDELRSFIQMLNPDKLILIGHGLGGLLGWLFVDKYPELVHKFVSIATPHPQVLVKKIHKNWNNVKKHR